MTLFPLFLKLARRRCLVVGAGTIAEGKIASLLDARARVRVVAPQATPTIAAWARNRRLMWIQRAFEPADLDRAFLVIAATSSVKVHRIVFREARHRGVLCNAVDEPTRCDFYYPAVFRRGDLQIAVSTSGRSPALAQRLRRELEAQFGPGIRSVARSPRTFPGRAVRAVDEPRSAPAAAASAGQPLRVQALCGECSESRIKNPEFRREGQRVREIRGSWRNQSVESVKSVVRKDKHP
ncbi:MAG TPA: bifunctional precorrin-2 dehydrogenase/sirohydrochlorin ferrochelatase [Vicinamibacterales bacterium]|nr:bifunctional precorrin-2 dehydrogenase/sirohydrochlorin ferrochelatase [Vicinamibacterales bacterium]